MYVVYVAAAGDRHIHVMALDPKNGKVTPIEVVEAPGPDAKDPISLPLTLSPDWHVLYASIRVAPYPTSAFAIDRRTGRLTLLGSSNEPDGMCHISVDKSGRFLLAACFTGSKVAVTPIGSDGRLASSPTDVFGLPRAHCIVPSSDGRFAYVASHSHDTILQYELDRTNGRLVASNPRGLASAAGAGPRHLEIHASTERMYAVNEQNGSVDMLAIDTHSGNLRHIVTATMLPAGYDAVSAASDIHITRNGRFLFASERTKSFLVSYAVDPKRGTLTPIEWVDTEECPRGFAIDPTDRYLLCAGQFSGGMSVYAIDQTNGKLNRTDKVAIGPNPNWIEIIELP